MLRRYKVDKSVTSNSIPVKIVEKYTAEILDYVLYDAERCLAVEQFEPVKSNTHCVFAKTARLWGSRDYDIVLSLEENVKRLVMYVRSCMQAMCVLLAIWSDVATSQSIAEHLIDL